MKNDNMQGRRLRDFSRRKQADPDVRQFRDTEYVAVHPFADDLDLLARLAWPAEKCASVDAYWHALGDILFLQVCSSSLDQVRGVGTYARWDPSATGVVLYVIVEDSTVTRGTFSKVMEYLLDSGAARRALNLGQSLGGKLRLIQSSSGPTEPR